MSPGPSPIVAAADGSALRNPVGPAAWCWYVDDSCWAAGGWASATNNVAELTAILRLLEATRGTGVPLLVECDSQYAINCATVWIHNWKRRGWQTADRKPVKNVELIQAIDAALEGRDVRFEWVRGHTGHPRQEAADLRARTFAESIDAGRAPNAGPGWRG